MAIGDGQDELAGRHCRRRARKGGDAGGGGDGEVAAQGGVAAAAIAQADGDAGGVVADQVVVGVLDLGGEGAKGGAGGGVAR